MVYYRRCSGCQAVARWSLWRKAKLLASDLTNSTCSFQHFSLYSRRSSDSRSLRCYVQTRVPPSSRVPSMRLPIMLTAWLLVSLRAYSQAGTDFAQPTPAESLIRPAGLSRDLGVPEPPSPLAPIDPNSPERGIEFFPRGDLTYLPRAKEHGFGIFDVEALGEIRIPLDGLPPLKVSPGFAARMWDGPSGCMRPDVAGTVYDFYVDLAWRPRPFEWLFLDLKFTPGIYTDMNNFADSFRPRGHTLAIIHSRAISIRRGSRIHESRADHDRSSGRLAAPSEDTEFRIVFPAPKISQPWVLRRLQVSCLCLGSSAAGLGCSKGRQA